MTRPILTLLLLLAALVLLRWAWLLRGEWVSCVPRRGPVYVALAQ